MSRDGALYLSWTAANRYEDCGERQHAWKEKRVKKAMDETPFFMGRVFHASLEWWLLHPGSPDMDKLFAYYWPRMEAETEHLFWKPDQRQERWEKGVDACRTAQQTLELAEIHKLHVQVERKERALLGHGVGMYAQGDILAWHPTEPLVYIIEAKSGTSYSAKQVHWYAAVFARTVIPTQSTIYAASLRPAVTDALKPRPVTLEDRAVQEERALRIGTAMLRDEWPVNPGPSCSWCEARTTCPSYKATFGHLQKGRVGVGPRTAA